MRLSPREVEHLQLHQAGVVAQKRLARSLRLNYVETVALIASQCLELIRDGRSVAEIMSLGKAMLGLRQVMDGVSAMLHDVQVEGTFPDGTKLVTVHNPICRVDGDMSLALYGSFFPVPSLESFGPAEPSVDLNKQIIVVDDENGIELNGGRVPQRLVVKNMGDRPIQVGSHFHLIETNPILDMDRRRAYGHRLNIPAGTAPGDVKTVSIVPIGGHRVISGGNNVATGPVDQASIDGIVSTLVGRGFLHTPIDPTDEELQSRPPPCIMSRQTYARTYGPTTGDRIRLGDTSLVVHVEMDFTVYGDECTVLQTTRMRWHFYLSVGKFGGGKVLREGMGQATGCHADQVLDTVITNAVIVDYTGVYKADIGIKHGVIWAIGKAGNPDVMDGVQDDMVRMLQATDACSLNIGFTGKGNTASPIGLQDVVNAGVVGLKLHEDWGTTPSSIHVALDVADANDIQVTIHTDTLNESSCVEQTIAAFGNRTIHTYHSEGAGGGHAPDIITVCGELHVLPSSTNPTRPFTVNTIEEHVDMLVGMELAWTM
ncbi:hypothetical protein DYB32_007160 [Aphanomyces invadans]|uniref:urease n=1 Tax=Aphanomyces invadans TaxID=157072 RepID=A0A418AP70_9STRA|nr:hypothetical protein DYB32_007160 [Aphanomyces invadans]